MKRLHIRLRTLLSLVMLLAVLGTAALVHVSWQITARRNVDETVRALNRQILAGVANEVSGILASASAALDSVRTLLFQRVIDVGHPAKREFLFLASLQSHPSISWVAFGWPDGRFFGAHKVDDGRIQMVETTWDAQARSASRRIDHYAVGTGDIWFQRRETGAGGRYAPGEGWYGAAMAADGPVWSGVHTLPVSGKAGISTSVRLDLAREPVGVITVAIALERLSLYLRSLPVGDTGTVFIVNAHNELIASQDPAMAPRRMDEDADPRLMMITDLGYPFLRVANAALGMAGLKAGEVDAPLQLLAADPDSGEPHFVTLAPLGRHGWVVVTVIPAADFLAGIERSTERLLLALLGVTAAIALAATLLARVAVASPLARLTDQVQLIEDFELDRTRGVDSRIAEIERLSGALVRMTHGLAHFQRYLPTALVRTLVAEGIEARPQSREATMLFADLESFTAIGESMSPEALVALLNEYFEAVTPSIERFGGVITQYQGDAILAVWNVPTDDPDHALNAVRAALDIQRVLAERRFADGIRLKARCGVSTGPVVAGSVGSRDRVNYTVHGDAVNLAARLEALNKAHGTRVLVGERTAERVRAEIPCERIGELPIRGKRRQVTVYKVL